MSDPLPLAVAITGASGSVYGLRLLDVLEAAGREVHLTLSPAAGQVFAEEVGVTVDLKAFDAGAVLRDFRERWAGRPSSECVAGGGGGRVRYWHFRNFSAGMASGSFRTGGMAVCPCSMGTLAAVAHGMSQNLIHRAADVHLKERRTLVLVPRETPLGVVQLQNMAAVAAAGAVVLPAMPGFYHRPRSVEELVDFVVQRVCDQLGVEVRLSGRWGEE